MADNRLPLIASDQLPAVDDCWNRIGIHGDKSCERLAAHVHCRNCEVHAAAATLLSGFALSATAEAAPFHRHGGLTPYERAAIARSAANLNALKWRVRADRRVTPWERVQLRIAQAKHNALVHRLRYN